MCTAPADGPLEQEADRVADAVRSDRLLSARTREEDISAGKGSVPRTFFQGIPGSRVVLKANRLLSETSVDSRYAVLQRFIDPKSQRRIEKDPLIQQALHMCPTLDPEILTWILPRASNAIRTKFTTRVDGTLLFPKPLSPQQTHRLRNDDVVYITLPFEIHNRRKEFLLRVGVSVRAGNLILLGDLSALTPDLSSAGHWEGSINTTGGKCSINDLTSSSPAPYQRTP